MWNTRHMPLRFPRRRHIMRSRVTGNWFDRTSEDLFFPQCQPIAPIFAEGVLKTLELSLNGKGDPVPSIPGGLSINQT